MAEDYTIVKIKQGQHIKTGEKFQRGTIIDIIKNDCFSTFIIVEYKSGKRKKFLV